MPPKASSGIENTQRRIAIHFPDRRELLWVMGNSPLLGWEVGQVVVYRDTSWVVLDRLDSEDAWIIFVLGVE